MALKPPNKQLANKAFLALESHRLKHAFSFDPLLSMRVSNVDSLPHQIEAVYEHVLKKHRIRFMLAHDPGAGKTIMAGLILKDLKMRNIVKRVLVVVPGQLREQWKWELKNRFDLDFDIVTRDTFTQKGRTGVWEDDLLVTSIDFAKRDDVLKSLRDARFDLVIVDEAHKMSAYSYGRTTSKTKRYHLGEALSLSSKHMLFLTATPHKGDAQNFRLLLDLLEPGFFSAAGMIEDSVREGFNPVFLRRAKEDMVDFDGAPLFVPREVRTPDVRLSKHEKTLYTAMSKYVTEQYNLATRSVKSHNITFALIILQRRFASSIYALTKSLKRRMDKLEQIERAAEKVSFDDISDDYVEKVDEMSEKERWEEEQKWELITAAQNMDELRAEIDIIADLIQKAQKVIGSEAKLFQLKEMLENLDKTNPNEKILIFTESKDTLDYLTEHVRSWGYSVNNIHGSMGGTERKEAENIFKNDTRIMVATEAAGEGINLQFCRLMINYDLPWNPNRLEQRMGRIHRYGQKLDVNIFNLVIADTREGEILIRLFEKLEHIRSVMGNDKIFDVISDIVPGKSLAQLMLDATVKSKGQKKIISELDTIMGDTEAVKEQMQDNFTSRRMDDKSLKMLQATVRENSLVPEYSKNLFCDIVDTAGGNVKSGDDYEGLTTNITVPKLLLSDDHDSSKDITAVFDAYAHEQIPNTDLVTFGHVMFDAALEWAMSQFTSSAMDGKTTVLDPTGRLDGNIAFYTGSVVYGITGEQVSSHMIACIVDLKAGTAKCIPSSVILDLDWNYDKKTDDDFMDSEGIEYVQKMATDAVNTQLDSYASAIADEGRIQANMAQKYGLHSLDALLDGIESDIMQLLEKKRRGVKADLAIYNKRQDRIKYRTARRNMEERIKSDTNLTVDNIKCVGMIRVMPGTFAQSAKKLSAVEFAIEFEHARGRTPVNMSHEWNGYDIRSAPMDSGGGSNSGSSGNNRSSSSSGSDVRYILALKEQDGWVYFTTNEWLKALTLGERYYLYVIRGVMQEPLVLSDPAHVLRSERRGTTYCVSVDRILSSLS